MYALNCFLKMANSQWDVSQWRKWVAGEGGTTRMEEAASGRVTDKIYKTAETLFASPSAWSTLRGQAVSWRCSGLALCMLSCTLCPLEPLLFSPWRGYPYKIFLLLTCHTAAFAAELLSDPACLKDAWSVQFLERFFTVPLLLGEHCTAILRCLARILRIDISRIECGNATIRRLQRSSGGTWANRFLTVSSSWTLLKQRIAERLLRMGTIDAQKKAVKKKAGPFKRNTVKDGIFKGTNTGGGGVARASLSDNLRKHSMKTKEERRAAFTAAHAQLRRDRAANNSSFKRAQELGTAGTIAHKRRNDSSYGVAPAKKAPRRVPAILRLPYFQPREPLQPLILDGAVEHDDSIDANASSAAAIDARASEALALAEQVLAQDELALELEELERSAKAKASYNLECEEEVLKWSKSSAEDIASRPGQPLLGPGDVDSAVTHVLPSGPTIEKHDVIMWIAPATDLAKRALAKPQPQKCAVGLMRKHWKHRHMSMKHQDQPKIADINKSKKRHCPGGEYSETMVPKAI